MASEHKQLGNGSTHLGQASTVGSLRLNVGHVSVEVPELVHGGAEGHDFAAGILGTVVLGPHGCSEAEPHLWGGKSCQSSQQAMRPHHSYQPRLHQLTKNTGTLLPPEAVHFLIRSLEPSIAQQGPSHVDLMALGQQTHPGAPGWLTVSHLYTEANCL